MRNKIRKLLFTLLCAWIVSAQVDAALTTPTSQDCVGGSNSSVFEESGTGCLIENQSCPTCKLLKAVDL